MFRKNVGSVDRAGRVVLGLALIGLALGLFGDTGFNRVGYIGFVALATAVFGLCPLYSLIGLSTRKEPQSG
jgi:hypothetical protein